MASKLGEETAAPRHIPLRPLPFGSEQITSPTYVAPRPRTSEKTTVPASSHNIADPVEEPSYKGPSAAWEKDEEILTQETPMPPSEEEKDVLET